MWTTTEQPEQPRKSRGKHTDNHGTNHGEKQPQTSPHGSRTNPGGRARRNPWLRALGAEARRVFRWAMAAELLVLRLVLQAPVEAVAEAVDRAPGTGRRVWGWAWGSASSALFFSAPPPPPAKKGFPVTLPVRVLGRPFGLFCSEPPLGGHMRNLMHPRSKSQCVGQI